jgi:hypothetical protein
MCECISGFELELRGRDENDSDRWRQQAMKALGALAVAERDILAAFGRFG